MDVHAERPENEGSGARAALERELYWAQPGNPRGRMSTPELRDALHDFALRMRADGNRPNPEGEPTLPAALRSNRYLKKRAMSLLRRSMWLRRARVRFSRLMRPMLFRAMRPVSRRYDRLNADLAELATSLADRLTAAEAEIQQLRGQLEERRRTAVPKTGARSGPKRPKAAPPDEDA